MGKIKVLIVDDQPIIRDGLKMILSLCDDIEVVAETQNGEEAINVCRRNEIDVVLMDVRMPVMNGVRATGLIREEFPKTRVIILTTFNDDEYIFDALKNGAASYLLKDVASEEIINTIRVIHSGGTLLHANIASRVVKGFTGQRDRELLTPRETDIAKLVAQGMSNREIAKELFITEGTVKNHITNILSKLDLSHRTQIALYVVEKGWNR